MSEIHTGSCLCGAVHYQISGAMRPVVACHCHQCRKTSGHFVAATQVRIEQLVIKETGALKWFESSVSAKRGFCAHCGGNLFWKKSDEPLISIMAGTIDGRTGLSINKNIFAEYAGDYYVIDTI